MDASTFPVMLGFSKFPVSPPPDHRILFKQASSQTPAAGITNPLLFRSFANEMAAPAVKKAPSLLEKHFHEQQLLREKAERARAAEPQAQKQSSSSPSPPTPCCGSSTSTLTSSTSITSSSSTKVDPDAKPQIPPTPTTASAPPPPQQTQHNQPPTSLPENPFPNHPNLLDNSLSSDPKYVQMVSRMAAFYQQRCQAILNYQQQRCQTWANTHRQKCQEMMQAAMLVVAWYIRDRIGRRRRRNKRSFRRGLREKNSAARRGGIGKAGGAPTKGETVRKWVTDIPEAALSPTNGIRDDMVLDQEEREFDVEKEVIPDKDGQLFMVADEMIKSQLAKIDVPLLGALNLDDSDSESESEDEERCYYEPEDYDMEDEDEYDDDDLDYEEESVEYVEDVSSKEAVHGTGKGSLKRKRSESTSGIE